MAKTMPRTVAAIDPHEPSRYRPASVVDFVAATSSGGTVQRSLALALGGMAKRSAAMPRPTPRPPGMGADCVRWSFFLVLASLSGCAVRPSTFEIVDYRDPGDAKRYQESFDEAYYDLDNHGNVNLVLRRSGAGEGDGAGESDVTQVIRIRSVWRPVPGRTVSHATQINATVSYFIASGRVGDAFEGAGSVFFSQDRGKDTLTGTLDHAVLRPKRQLAPGEPLFARAELSGEFRAARDRRQVVRIMNETDRRFGPMPPHDTAK